MQNTGKVKISWLEATSILTVSQIFSTVAFSIESQNGLNTISCMVAFLIGTAMNFLIILPFILLIRRFGYVSLLDASYKTFGKFASIIAIALFLILIATAANTVSTFETFLSTTVFQKSSQFAIIILITLAAAYGAFLGFEALGRFANIVFALVSFAILLILVSILKDIELINFGTLNFKDTQAILKTAVKGVLSNSGIIAATLLTPIVNKKHFKGFAFWNIASLILVEIIAFSVTGVLGEYAQAKPYPYFSTATVAELSVLKRLDAIYMCVWILVAFIKTTYYLLLAKNILDTVLHKSAKKYSLAFCAGLLFITSVIASLRPVFNEYLKMLNFSGYAVVIAVVILPLIILIISVSKGEKANGKT